MLDQTTAALLAIRTIAELVMDQQHLKERITKLEQALQTLPPDQKRQTQMTP